jgi:hypothetical protein
VSLAMLVLRKIAWMPLLGLAILTLGVALSRTRYRGPGRREAEVLRTEAVPGAGTNPYRPTYASDGAGLPDWAAFRNAVRWPERFARLGLAIALVGVFLLPVILWLARHPESAALKPLLTQAIVLLSVAIAFTWEEPALGRRRDYVRAVLAERGLAANRSSDADFVGVAEQNRGTHLGNGSDDVGFATLDAAELTLHLASGELRVARDAVTSVERVRFRGDTMGLYGVKPVWLRWRTSPEAAERSLYLVAKGGESAFAFARATDGLAERLTRWRDRGPARGG